MHSLSNDVPLYGMFMEVYFGSIYVIRMVMESFILTVDVGVGVAMLMGMGVYQTAMPVFMGVDMGMFMGVLQTDGVLDHKDRCKDHDDQTHIELNTRMLVQQQDTEGYTKEGSDGVIGTGLGGTQVFLGFDIKVDA